MTVEELLARARSALVRLEPAEVAAALAAGAVLVDIRSDPQRAAGGEVPGAVRVAATSWSGAATPRPRGGRRRSPTRRGRSS